MRYLLVNCDYQIDFIISYKNLLATPLFRPLFRKVLFRKVAIRPAILKLFIELQLYLT